MNKEKEKAIKSAIDHQKQNWVKYIRMKLEKIFEDSILFKKREVIDGSIYNFISLKNEFLDDIAKWVFDLFEKEKSESQMEEEIKHSKLVQYDYDKTKHVPLKNKFK